MLIIGEIERAASTADHVAYWWAPVDVDAMRFESAFFCVHNTGDWDFEQKCRNGSGHKDLYVDMWLMCSDSRTTNIIWTHCLWNGRFGSGYQEVKKANGFEAKIRDAWKAFEDHHINIQLDPRLRRV